MRALEDERYYGLTAVLANSLGSALGDLVGDKLGAGILGGKAVNAGILAPLLAAYRIDRAPRGLPSWSRECRFSAACSWTDAAPTGISNPVGAAGPSRQTPRPPSRRPQALAAALASATEAITSSATFFGTGS